MADTSGRAPITTAAGLVSALSTVLGVTDASYRLEQRVRSRQGESLDATTVQAPVRAEVAPSLLPGPSGAADTEEPMRVVRREGPRRGWVVGLLVLVALAVVVGLVGVAINSGRDRGGSTPDGGVRTPAPSGLAGPYEVVDVTSFDPTADGGNDEENEEDARLAVDDDPTTGWQTLRYLGSAELGGLKPGVGLVLDLGERRSVGSVVLQVYGQGSDIEIHVPADDDATQAPTDTIEDWRRVAGAERASRTIELAVDPAVETRFVLVYLTRLAPDGADFRGGIDEVQVGP